MSERTYPPDFLGRCQICLDNAYLSEEPCAPAMGINGRPLFKDDCPVYRARQSFDRLRADPVGTDVGGSKQP